MGMRRASRNVIPGYTEHHAGQADRNADAKEPLITLFLSKSKLWANENEGLRNE
jgi:hypothetical protein